MPTSPLAPTKPKALASILDEGHKKDLWYLSNQDMDAHPRVDQWSNGTDAAAELKRMMEIRKVALSRFGEQAIKRNAPMATIEEVLVPLYLHHRYQVEAAASTVGGIYFTYSMRGDGREPVKFAPAAEQQAALTALMETLQPSVLALPRDLLTKIPPRPSGYGNSRELFPRYTGQMFDAITPAVVAADLTLGFLLDDARAAQDGGATRARRGVAGAGYRDRPGVRVDVCGHELECRTRPRSHAPCSGSSSNG